MDGWTLIDHIDMTAPPLTRFGENQKVSVLVLVRTCRCTCSRPGQVRLDSGQLLKPFNALRAILCCAMLCCAVLCCAVQCRTVQCSAVLCNAMLCCAVLCCGMLRYAVLCCRALRVGF